MTEECAEKETEDRKLARSSGPWPIRQIECVLTRADHLPAQANETMYVHARIRFPVSKTKLLFIVPCKVLLIIPTSSGL